MRGACVRGHHIHIHHMCVSTETMDPFLVVWAKITLLHCAKNRHFVLASIQAALTVAELFSTFARLSQYSQTSSTHIVK